LKKAIGSFRLRAPLRRYYPCELRTLARARFFGRAIGPLALFLGGGFGDPCGFGD
jgi:hypothetical protein